jgi:dsRNA-specific ribonuclease
MKMQQTSAINKPLKKFMIIIIKTKMQSRKFHMKLKSKLIQKAKRQRRPGIVQDVNEEKQSHQRIFKLKCYSDDYNLLGQFSARKHRLASGLQAQKKTIFHPKTT